MQQAPKPENSTNKKHSSNPQRQATTDLIKRYVRVFWHAWRQRKDMRTIARLPHEAQFLPAALALQETPISPAPRIAMWLLIIFATLAVLWASLGHIDVVATAQGKIVPNDRTKTVQAFETATVKAIHISDGQTVKAGDILIELDATNAQADQDRVQSDLGVAQLQVARAQAMLAALSQHKKPALKRPDHVNETKFQEAQQLLGKSNDGVPGQAKSHRSRNSQAHRRIAFHAGTGT